MTDGTEPLASGAERLPDGAERPEGGDVAGAPAGTEPALPSERGRDLTLLALAIVVLNEAVFLAEILLLQEQQHLVAQAGRFAVRAGLAYMTWQGFGVPRWLLAFLTAVAAFAGPLALRDVWAAGSGAWPVILTVVVAGYFVATWLLVGSREVSAFLRYRRALRDSDVRR